MTLSLGLLVGVELVAAAALLFLFGRPIARRWPAHAWLVGFGRIALGIVGLGLVASSTFLADTTPDSRLANPVPFSVSSVQAGTALYEANCAACHGVDARGGGPQAGTTQIRPPSLVSGHLDTHPDGDIFYWLTNGLPGGMPAWGSSLSETQRWDLVNYLRSLNGRTPTGAGDPASAIGLAGLPLGIAALGGGLTIRARRSRVRGRGVCRRRRDPDEPPTMIGSR